jgi:glycosyltransferase involved in cell wall biosynthesis
LVVLLHPGFPAVHPQIWSEIQTLPLPRNAIQLLPEEGINRLLKGPLIVRAFRVWCVLRKAVRDYCPQICFINKLDLLLLPIALGGKLGPKTKVAGILFRPTLHYHLFQQESGLSWLNLLYRLQKKFILWMALRNPSLIAIFSLDPYAVSGIQSLSPQDKARFLPEPFLHPEPSESAALLTNLGVDPERVTFLVFGVLSRRKGIFQVLDALSYLSEEQAARTNLFYVGRINPEIKEEFLVRMEEARKASSAQISIYDGFISNQEAGALFSEIDVVLGLYERSFVGSSGLLIWAASAEKPLLVSSYGMIGKFVSDHKFGFCVDPENPAEIAAGMEKFLVGDYPEIDLQAMRRYANQNDSQHFAKAIIDTLYRRESRVDRKANQ